jgi:copper chaperone CopZ
MSCGACSGAVERVLKKVIEERELRPRASVCKRPPSTDFRVVVDIPANNFSVSLKDQEVLVWGASKPPFEEVKAKIAKTGKKVSSKVACFGGRYWELHV